MVTRPEESYRMWCVWVWSWSLDTEEALALCGLVHHVKNVSCYARTVDSSKINLFGSWTEIVNTCTAEVSCTGLVKWIAVSPVLFPVGDKTRCPCLASSRVRYSCGSEDVKRNCAILGEVFLTFIQDDFEHTHTHKVQTSPLPQLKNIYARVWTCGIEYKDCWVEISSGTTFYALSILGWSSLF